MMIILREKSPGTILRGGDGCIDLEPLPDDFECLAMDKELNEMRDSINRMRIEDGEPCLTEEEWPDAKEDE